jgi:hypothetical protein
MTQFFDALERQLVTLSRDSPRMTPRVRNTRRLAVGTVTLLCLLASGAGTTLLPRSERYATVGAKTLFAALRSGGGSPPGRRGVPRADAGRTTRGRAQTARGRAADTSYGAGACGRSVPIDGAARSGSRLPVDMTAGRLQGLICSTRESTLRERDKALSACGATRRSAPSLGSAPTMRFIDDEHEQPQSRRARRGSDAGAQVCAHVPLPQSHVPLPQWFSP